MLLTIAEYASRDGRSTLTPLFERATITRLGYHVDRTHRLDQHAQDRTLACLRDYAADLQRLGASRLAVVGTSALRDAVNGADFIEQAEGLLGTTPRVITGAEEALLTFAGALSGLSVRGSVLVADIGGGSTELIGGEAAPIRVDEAVSLDVGSVRLTERHFRSDPPTQHELGAARRDVRAALTALPEPAPEADLIGVAGTVTTLVAIALGLESYRGADVHGAPLSSSAVSQLTRRLAALPLARRREVPGLDPGRADVIVAGALLLDELMAWSRKDRLLASDRGVRWGLLAELAAGK